MESDVAKGYRGGAGHSSNVGVPESSSPPQRMAEGRGGGNPSECPNRFLLAGTPSVGSGLKKAYRGGGSRSSKVGVPACVEWLWADSFRGAWAERNLPRRRPVFKQSGCPGARRHGEWQSAVVRSI